MRANWDDFYVVRELRYSNRPQSRTRSIMYPIEKHSNEAIDNRNTAFDGNTTDPILWFVVENHADMIMVDSRPVRHKRPYFTAIWPFNHVKLQVMVRERLFLRAIV